MYKSKSRKSPQFRAAVKSRMSQCNPNIQFLEELRELQRLERQRIKNLPENVEKRKIADENYLRSLTERNQKIEASETSCQELYAKLFKALSQAKTPSDIPALIKSNIHDLTMLENESLELINIKRQKIALFSINYYDRLFAELSNKVMPEFVLYANDRIFSDKNLPIARLSNESLIALEENLQSINPELLENEDFLETYGYMLPYSTSKITLENQSRKCKTAEFRITEHLKRFPENYTKIDKALKYQMISNNEFQNLLLKSKELVKYMSVKELSWLAMTCPKSVGSALFFYPEELERIADKDPAFFNTPKHSPYQIFQNGLYVLIDNKLTQLNKKMYAEALKDYYDLFLELGIYFRLPVNQHPKIQFYNLTDREKLDKLNELKEKESLADL